MAIILILFAACFASITNFCMRKSIDAGGSAKTYLVVQLSLAFIIMIILNPVRTGIYTWNSWAALLGIIAGLVLGFLMWSLGKTLEKGPPGLTFAALNSASVMPGAVMSLIFGVAFGHDYTFSNAVGSILVILGLFWAGWSIAKGQNKLLWILFASLTFITHVIFLSYLQWWALLSKNNLPSSPLLPFYLDPENSQWFMPMMLLTAALVQWTIYLTQETKRPKAAEIIYGAFGGVTNGICTFLMIVSAQLAIGWENVMIFPIFSVAIIIICNIWGQLLYKENVNWKANAICMIGLVIGTITWSKLI